MSGRPILVLGAGGMAGHMVASYLASRGYEVDGITRSRKVGDRTRLLDVTRFDELRALVTSRPYAAVVNCVGMLIAASERDKPLAVRINSLLPHLLEEWLAVSDTRVVHLSTDCVFSGANGPYREDSIRDGELFYDRSKGLGELINDKDLTLRMSIIGPELDLGGSGLFNWFMNQDGEIRGYRRTIWNGITTFELARSIEAALETPVTGLYHLVPDGNISKYELLEAMKRVFNRSHVEVTPVDEPVSDKTLINTRGDLPAISADYEAMLERMKAWMLANPGLYAHYGVLSR